MQSERVTNPPLIRSASVGVNSRAPRRINTLLWSMFFSFHCLGSVDRAQTYVESLQAALYERPALKLALAQESVAIPAIWAPGDDIGVDETAAIDLLDFLRCKITSALANQHFALVIHTRSPFRRFRVR